MPDQQLPPVVDVSWLERRLDAVVLADVRWSLAGGADRDGYRQDHLPGAVFVDLDTTLAAEPSPEAGRHPLPDPAVFASALAQVGIGDADPVVAYDSAGGAAAARLVWLLRAIDHPAALLDGGLDAWPGELESGTTARPPASFTPRPWPSERLATADEVAAGPRDDGVIVVDARAPTRYRGEEEPVDARAGHVPGAVNVPFTANLDPTTLRFEPPERLRRRYQAAGVDTGDEVIVYCGSGVTACLDLLALERAGLGPGRLYPGSWSQWAADPARPVATGPEP